MPHMNVQDCDLYFEDTGRGSETIVFSHGLLMNHTMFDAQVETLRDSYRCVRYDHRCQGRSEITESGCDMDSLCEDAAELIRRLDCGPVHFVGLSMGGFVGLRLAVRHPRLLHSLTLLETSADPDPFFSRFKYRLLATIARRFGFRPLIGHILPLMFGRSFLRDPSRQAELAHWRNYMLQSDVTGILLATMSVVDRAGVYEELADITTPTLVIVGDEDLATPPSKAERMHRGIRTSQLTVIRGAGHSSTIERPAAVTAAMLDFLVRLD